VSTPRAERGDRLGLPASGAGSLAGYGPRLGAFLIDALLSSLVAGLFTAPELPRMWSLLAFACEYTFFAATFGQTPGMAALRLALVRVGPVRAGSDPGEGGSGEAGGAEVSGTGRASFGRVALRTVLLILLVPAVIADSDGRGLHDRASGTAVIKLR
jgi:uncharacterized RDD family membrane protein YckC